MIRPLKQTDYAAVKRMFHDVFDASEDPYFVTAWRNRSPSFGYFIDTIPIGAAIVSNGALNYIYTHADYRGGGIGTQLLRSVMAAYPNVHLTPVNDPEVIGWYERHGFRLSRDGDRKVYVRHQHALRNKGTK